MKEKISIVVFIALLSIIPTLTTISHAQEYPELGVKVETIAENLTIPWSIDWTPEGTIFFTERDGNLRVIQDGKLLEKPLLSLGVGGVEGGLLGIAVDPNYSENNYIYLYYTYNELISTSNKVVRYQVAGDGKTITEDKVLVEGIPGGPFHDGGRIQFGPDGKLYITTGEAGNPGLSQDTNSLGGKILRINSDGTIPDDNPLDASLIYSYGHRNPQGLDWDESGNLLATEHGPSGIRGKAHDEINLVIPGTNYGWPDIIGDESKEGLQVPILHSGDDTWAPSDAEFYKGDKIPQWTGKYFVATLRGSHLHMIDFDSENKTIISHEKLFQDEFGRIRDVATGPDRFLYLLTSNQDGRGTPKNNDDRILRIISLDNSINNFEECVSVGNQITESHPRQCSTLDGLHFTEKSKLCQDVSELNPITVHAEMEKLDKGNQIKVEGCVDPLAYFKGINITILDPSGSIIRSGAIVPETDGSFRLLEGFRFNVDGEFSVIVDANNEYVSTSEFIVKYNTFVTNSKIELDPNGGFWENYFQYGDVINGKVHFIGKDSEMDKKVNLGTSYIEMVTPDGEKITVASSLPITNNYAEFSIPITNDKEFHLGKYQLRANYNINENYYFGNSQETFYVGQEQTFHYTEEGSPLDVRMHYVEYDISPIRFDIDEKSISFDFKKIDGEFTPDENWQFENDIGLLIQRPLISPPYTIIVESGNDTMHYEPNEYEIKITSDNFYKYALSLDEQWEEGTITIIGTYVIPEFGQIIFFILAVSIISMIVLSTKFLAKMKILR